MILMSSMHVMPIDAQEVNEYIGQGHMTVKKLLHLASVQKAKRIAKDPVAQGRV